MPIYALNYTCEIEVSENSGIWRVSLLCICTKYLRNALKLQKISKYQSLKGGGVNYKQKLVFAETIGQSTH